MFRCVSNPHKILIRLLAAESLHVIIHRLYYTSTVRTVYLSFNLKAARGLDKFRGGILKSFQNVNQKFSPLPTRYLIFVIKYRVYFVKESLNQYLSV